MDIQKAIEWMKDMQEYCKDVFRPVDRETSFYIIMALRELEQYRQIGTPDECREAREKQVPKKPEKCGGVIQGIKECGEGHPNYVSIQEDYLEYPNCGSFVGWSGDCENSEIYRCNYCADCGQTIDWSDSNE